ncbi:MAG TPA: hypothetical protein VK420_00495 [Longimicrobium sp.]|nr:hypothetical protein [Longimicrobium sp.]
MNADQGGRGVRASRWRGVQTVLTLVLLAACEPAPASQPATLLSKPLPAEPDTATFEPMELGAPPASTPEPTSSAEDAQPEEEDDGDLYAYPAWNGVDLDCPDVGHSVKVTGDDPHRLDRDGDGWGCESY